jgi:hypothetical protein
MFLVAKHSSCLMRESTKGFRGKIIPHGQARTAATAHEAGCWLSERKHDFTSHSVMNTQHRSNSFDRMLESLLKTSLILDNASHRMLASDRCSDESYKHAQVDACSPRELYTEKLQRPTRSLQITLLNHSELAAYQSDAESTLRPYKSSSEINRIYKQSVYNTRWICTMHAAVVQHTRHAPPGIMQFY